MLVNITFYTDKMYEVIAEEGSAFELVFILDNSPNVRQWKLQNVGEHSLKWYHSGNWEKLKMNYSDWDFS